MIHKPQKPTFYFIGVTTTRSSIMRIFPLWVKELGLSDTAIVGYDVEVKGSARKYREIVEHIKKEEMALGALVTTHKIDIVDAAGDYFDYFDEYAEIFGEISCISMRDGKLRGHAKDPVTAGLGLEAFLPEDYWIKNPQACVLILGAGGSGIALSAYLMRAEHGRNVPSKIFISNRRISRLDHCREVHDRIGRTTDVEYVQVTSPETNDEVLRSLPSGSLVVNATGMGKDRPGSPLSDKAVFPRNGYVWEFNYRGALDFMHQALNQKERRNLVVEDGWIYFIHGWTQVMAEVFDIEISAGDIPRLSEVALGAR